MNKEQQELLGDAYKNYLNNCLDKKCMKENVFFDGSSNHHLYLKEEFIGRVITNPDFAKQWGLKIEERELSRQERYDWFIKTYNTNLTRSGNQYDMEDILNSNNCPTKLITITYNDKTIESYE
jgi:hypothetical protein